MSEPIVIAADSVNKLVLIHFSKPMTWLELTIQDARNLRDKLNEKIAELEDATTKTE